MGTNMQNFDLYDLGGSTAADMHEGPRPSLPPEQLTDIISQILDANDEAVNVMDLTRDDHRRYLAGMIAIQALDTPNNLVVTRKETT